MHSKVKTAVFPVAGMGSRFLPVTKAGPKEVLPIVDKPIIQYAVEEAIEAGITHLVFVTSNTKRAVEDYFDTNFELEARLSQAGKEKALKTVRDIVPPDVKFSYVRQSEPAGLGDAVLCARHIIEDEPFAVLLADDIIMHNSGNNTLRSMIDVYDQTKMSVLGVEKVPKEDTDKYGVVAFKEPTDEMDNKSYPISAIIEKPLPTEAPSNFAVVGRYVLIPSIFDYLSELPRGVGGEIQLTDAIAQLLEPASVYACPLQGKRYDCGSKIGFLQATIDFALRRPDLSADLIAYLKQLHQTNYSLNTTIGDQYETV